jgi:hypothetical protein
MVYQVIGLISDIIGAVLLFYSTEIMNRILIQLITYVASSNTKVARSSKVVGIITADKKKATNYSRWGLILLVLGFLLQLLGTVIH